MKSPQVRPQAGFFLGVTQQGVLHEKQIYYSRFD